MAGDCNKKNDPGNRKFSRRVFVVESGTALAGGAIGAITAAKTQTPAAKKPTGGN